MWHNRDVSLTVIVSLWTMEVNTTATHCQAKVEMSGSYPSRSVLFLTLGVESEGIVVAPLTFFFFLLLSFL